MLPSNIINRIIPAEEPTHKSYSYAGFEKLSCGSATTLMSKVTALKPCIDNPKSATTLMSKVTALNPCFDNPKATPTPSGLEGYEKNPPNSILGWRMTRITITKLLLKFASTVKE